MAWKQQRSPASARRRQGKLPGETPLSLATDAVQTRARRRRHRQGRGRRPADDARHDVAGRAEALPDARRQPRASTRVSPGSLVDGRRRPRAQLDPAGGARDRRRHGERRGLRVRRHGAHRRLEVRRAAGRGDSWGDLGHVRQRRQQRATAQRHMALYGTTSEQLGWVAVTCRKHASMNPNAVMREPMTLDGPPGLAADRRPAAACSTAA